MRIERFGKSWRFIQFSKVQPDTRDARPVPKVHKVRHYEDEGEYWAEKWDEEERRDQERFESSITRARSRVKELALCNDWDYFATFTLCEEKQDRFDLRLWVRDLGRWIGNYNKRYNCKLQYLIIPEQHKSGAWHAHGLLRGLSPDSLVRNEYGYLDVPYYRNRFGYISLSAIKSRERCSTYVSKYITKDTAATCRAMGAGTHLFYASRGLEGREVVWQGSGTFEGGWRGQWCKIKWVDNDTVINKLSEVIKNEEIHHQRENERRALNIFAATNRKSGGRCEQREAKRGRKEACTQSLHEASRPPRRIDLCRWRGGVRRVIDKNQNVDTLPTESDSERIEREQAPLRARIAYSVSSPRRTFLEPPQIDESWTQFTFFGKETGADGSQ